MGLLWLMRKRSRQYVSLSHSFVGNGGLETRPRGSIVWYLGENQSRSLEEPSTEKENFEALCSLLVAKT